MGSFQQELIAGVLATVIGGLILAVLTGSGRGSRIFRLVLVVGALVAVGAFILSQQRGGPRWRRGDVPAVMTHTASLALSAGRAVVHFAAEGRLADEGPKPNVGAAMI